MQRSLVCGGQFGPSSADSTTYTSLTVLACKHAWLAYHDLLSIVHSVFINACSEVK